MHRAIACGAMVDPWNILGFQGLYPLFNAREDSVPDHRIGELVQVIERLMALYSRLRSDAATAGDAALGLRLATNMEKLATWWDRFASTTVNDIPHISGQEAAASAEHVVGALSRWHERGDATADLAFWREELHRFQTPKSFALVVEELLRKDDYRASMALLMNWLSQAEQVPLEHGDYSFHALALRWMLGITQRQGKPADEPASEELACKFIDYLEANAEDYWQVPRLQSDSDGEERGRPSAEVADEEEPLFGAAYEGVTFQDSADDGTEGELLGFEPQQEFELEYQTERLEGRLRFHSTVSRLFHLASRLLTRDPQRAKAVATTEALEAWLARASRNYQDLLALMDAIHERPIPSPSGSYDSLVEFDRRHLVKQRLLNIVIGTCLDSALAVGGMQSIANADRAGAKRPAWEPPLLQLEQAAPASRRRSRTRVAAAFSGAFSARAVTLYATGTRRASASDPPGQHRTNVAASTRIQLAETWPFARDVFFGARVADDGTGAKTGWTAHHGV